MENTCVVAQFDKEASQTRHYCVAKDATQGAARPDSLGKLGTGSSLRKKRLFRMTIKLHRCEIRRHRADVSRRTGEMGHPRLFSFFLLAACACGRFGVQHADATELSAPLRFLPGRFPFMCGFRRSRATRACPCAGRPGERRGQEGLFQRGVRGGEVAGALPL